MSTHEINKWMGYAQYCWDRGIKVIADFSTTKSDLGSYHPGHNVLRLNRNALLDKTELMDTMQHELIHAMQDEKHGGIKSSATGLLGIVFTNKSVSRVRKDYSHKTYFVQLLECEAFSGEDYLDWHALPHFANQALSARNNNMSYISLYLLKYFSNRLLGNSFSNGMNRRQDSVKSELILNEIIGSKRKDKLTGENKADYLWGGNGGDTLQGGGGDDLLTGGKGVDLLYGNSGKDVFDISKKMGKGRKNYDIVMDFEDGKDQIFVQEGTKGLLIENHKGNAAIYSGNDMLAFVPGAAGQLSMESNGHFVS